MSNDPGNGEHTSWSGFPAPSDHEPTTPPPVSEAPTTEFHVTGTTPQMPPPPPPWAPGPPEGPVAGGYWVPGAAPPGAVPPGTTPPYFAAAPQYPFGAPPPVYTTSPGKPLGARGILAVLAVVMIAASGVIGAIVEHTVDHNSASGFPSLGTGPSSGSSGLGAGSGTGTGSGSGSGSANAPAGVNTSAIASQVDPGLVFIDTTLDQGGAAAGTGMVLTASGLVLTNNHVIENATAINAQIVGSGRTYTATVLGYSVTDDVALLQLKGASGLKTVSTGNSSNLSVGQPVVAIGNAGGTGGTPTAVAGTVTALNQTITAGDAGTLSETLNGLIETDANIQPGDSGGALVNTSGKVVGMDTAASQNNGGSSQGYAIGINEATSIADQIKSGRASSTVEIGPRALLGVDVSDGSQSGGNGFFGGSQNNSGVAGAYVVGVASGSAADNAGIGTGDTIVSVNSTTISSATDLTNALLHFKPGDTVTVRWVDAQGTSHTSSVQLTAGPPA